MASKKCSKKRRTKQYKQRDIQCFANPVGAALLRVSHIGQADRDRYIDLSRRAHDLLEIGMCPISEYEELATQGGIAANLAEMGVCSDAESLRIFSDGLIAIAEVGFRIRDKVTPVAMRSHLDCIAALIERHEIQLMYAHAADVEKARKEYMATRKKVRLADGSIAPSQETAVSA